MVAWDAIYIQSNQNDSEKTIINKINLNINHQTVTKNENKDEPLGGECNIDKCDKIRYHFRDRRGKNEQESRESFIKDILSKIHCHTRHQYDVGFKLNEYQKQEVEEKNNNIDDNKDNDESIKDNNLLMIQCISRTRYKKLTSLPVNYRNLESNKFCTDLNKINIESKKEENETNKKNENKKKQSRYNVNTNYSYSFPFTYLDKFKNDQQTIVFGGKICDYHVASKYLSLKEELTCSLNLCFISISKWNYSMDKVKKHIQTQYAKGLIANTKEYHTSYQHQFNHPIHFGHLDSDLIPLNHLMAIYLYTEYDQLQYKFSETYRKIHDHESLKSVINRHSNYYHFARYIKETIEVFGTKYSYGYNDKMYHGINKQMIFNGINAQVYGPLSTSVNEMVAIQFTKGTGMIIELIPNPSNKYFVCNLISPYPGEQEILMGFGQYGGNIQLQNIKTGLGDNYKHYIPMLRMLETMTGGKYFMYDPSDILRLTTRDGKWIENGRNVKINKLRLLDSTDETIFGILICHQLALNGYKEKYTNIEQRSIYIKLYNKQMDQAGIFIKQLLNNISNKTKHIQINMNTMNNYILDECSNLFIDGVGGYIGYSKWNWLFLNHNKSLPDLNVFLGLFTDLEWIDIFELSVIDSSILNYIYAFLLSSNKQSNIWYIELHLLKSEDTDNKIVGMNLCLLCISYQTKFNSVGFRIDAFHDDPKYKTQGIFIKKF